MNLSIQARFECRTALVTHCSKQAVYIAGMNEWTEWHETCAALLVHVLKLGHFGKLVLIRCARTISQKVGHKHAATCSLSLSLSLLLSLSFAAFFFSISVALVNLCTRYVISKRECVSRSFKVEYGYIYIYTYVYICSVCLVKPLKWVSVCFLFYASSIILGHPYTEHSIADRGIGEWPNGITELCRAAWFAFTSHTSVWPVLWQLLRFAIILPDLDVASYIYGSFGRLWPVLTYYRRWMSNM